MFDAYLRIFEDEEREYPRDTAWSRGISLHILEERARVLDEWGVEQIVLVGEDCFMHPDIWDLCDYIIDELVMPSVTVMTRGRWVETFNTKRREVYKRDLDLIVPIDFFNPFERDDIFGYENYREVDTVLRWFPNVDVWQTVTGENLDRAMQLAGNDRLDWTGHRIPYPHPPHAEPDTSDQEVGAMYSTLQQSGRLHPAIRWAFVHYHTNDVREYPSFISDMVLESGKDYAGSIYVDEAGYVRSHVGVVPESATLPPLHDSDRSVLTRVAQWWQDAFESRAQENRGRSQANPTT